MGEVLMAPARDLAQAARAWPVWTTMAWHDLLMRYRRSLLGPFWISLSIAVLVLAMGFLYSQVFKQDVNTYMSYLAGGFLVWFLIAALITDACSIGQDNETILRNVPIPLSSLALRVVSRNLMIFAHNLLAIVIILAFFGSPFTWTLLLTVPALVIYAAFGFLVALILGPLATRFRDLTQIIASGLQIAFFLTPIIWSPSQVSERTLFVEGNPFFHLVTIFREPLLGQTPAALSWMVSLGMLAGLALIAMALFSRAKRRMYFWL